MEQLAVKFGEFLIAKRKEKGITQKIIAETLGVTPVYVCDIEKNRRYPPTKGDMLSKLSILLKLDEKDQSLMYDLAGYEKGCVSPDLSDYIMSSEIIRSALRTAKGKATADDWKCFIDNLDKKQK